MPKEINDLYEKHKDKLHLLILIAFAFVIGRYFWINIRPKIIFSSCNEIALNSTYVQARTSIFIDSSDNYEIALNECLIKAGVNP